MKGRALAAIAGIIGCAVAAIIVTAIIVVPAGSKSAAESSQESNATAKLPKLKPILLNRDEVSGLAGRAVTTTSEGNSLGQPAGPDYAVVPAACTSVAFFGQAVTYRNVAWKVARATQYKSVGGTVAQSIVLTASPSLAESFLTEQGKQWQKCYGKSYRFGTYSPNESVVTDVKIEQDRIVAETRQPAGKCQHVMAVHEAYVVETVTCGYPPLDASELADNIIGRIPS